MTRDPPPSSAPPPGPGEDPTSSPDPVAQFLEAALLATEEGRPSPIADWVRRFPELRKEFERAATTAIDIALVRTRVGPTFPGFVVESEIGRGGMGVVYLARQTGLNDRRVAIKVIGNQSALAPQSLAKFRAEARAVASLKHAHIVSVYDIIERGEDVAYVMEFVEGGSLDGLVRSLAARSPTPPHRVDAVREILDDPIGIVQEPTYVIFICRVAIAMFQALDAVHRDGLLHRDIKPANVLLRRDGTPLLTDFGLAVDSIGEPLKGVSGSNSNTRSEFSGTLGYAAPEQLRGRSLGRRSDIFALGATIYHALALRSPFPGATAREVLAQMESGAPDLISLNPDVPHDLAAIISKTMATDPFERYASAGEVASDLERLLRLEPVRARPQTRGYLLRKLIARNRAATAFAAGLIGALILGIVGTSAGMWRAKEAAARATAIAVEASENEYAATIQAAAAALAVYDGGTAKDRLDRIDPARRGWEWRYLNAQTDQSVGRLDVPGAAPGEAPLIAFSPDGDTLYTATRTTVAAFDASSWQVRWSVPAQVGPRGIPVALLPGWKKDLWVVAADGSIRTFDQSGGAQEIASASGATAFDAEWSPGRDRLLLLEVWEGESRLRGVDVDGAAPARTTSLPPGYGGQVAVETSLREVLCSGPAGTLCLKYPTMERVERSRQAGQTVVASNAAGAFFATSGAEGLILCVSSDPNSYSRSLAGMKPPQTLAWVPGSSGLLGGTGRVLSVWEALQWSLSERLIGHRADIRAIAASPDTRTAVSVDERGVVLRWCLKPVTLPLSPEFQAATTGATVSARRDVKAISTAQLLVRLSPDDASVLEVQREGSDARVSLQLAGPVSALAVLESDRLVFAFVPGIGVHVLRDRSHAPHPGLDASLVLDDAPLNTDELIIDGDCLVARSRGVEVKRWRTGPQATAPITPVHELIAADAPPLDNFGNAVRSDGARLIVGSPGADGAGGFDVGSAHVFRRHPHRGWIQECELMPSRAEPFSQAGRSVAIDGEWAAVGWPAPYEGRTARSGVTLFRFNRGCWMESQTLYPPAGHAFSHFGGSIAMHGGVLAVCSWTTWDGSTEARPVVVYALREGQWQLLDQAQPPKPLAPSAFGYSADVWHDQLVVSERLAPSGGKASVGRVHVYTIDESSVTWRQTLEPPEAAEGMQFGFGVSLRDDRLAVGAPTIASGNGLGSGKAYLYAKQANGEWAFDRVLEAPPSAAANNMGCWVAVGEDVVAVSSHDSTVNGQDQHGMFAVFPLTGEALPRMVLPREPLHAGVHFGANVTWLGDGFAASADTDSRYLSIRGSVWIVPNPGPGK